MSLSASRASAGATFLNLPRIAGECLSPLCHLMYGQGGRPEEVRSATPGVLSHPSGVAPSSGTVLLPAIYTASTRTIATQCHLSCRLRSKRARVNGNPNSVRRACRHAPSVWCRRCDDRRYCTRGRLSCRAKCRGPEREPLVLPIRPGNTAEVLVLACARPAREAGGRRGESRTRHTPKLNASFFQTNSWGRFLVGKLRRCCSTPARRPIACSAPTRCVRET